MPVTFYRVCFVVTAVTLAWSCTVKKASDLFDKTSPAVVSIQVLDKNDKLIGNGSGVVISEKGTILTNYHVLEASEKLVVISTSKEKYPVRGVIAADKNVDYALLKIDSFDTPKIKVGDSAKARIGDKIYTISSPVSPTYQNTFASGEISGIRQRELLPTRQTVENILGKELIQISAPISPGSSGGALINDKGELIGLLVAQSNEGNNLNFAIPINEIKIAFDSKSYLALSTFKEISLPNNSNKPISTTPRTSSNSDNPSLNPNYSFKDMLKLGNQDFEKQDYNGAILAWFGALREQPRNVVVLNKIAYALVQLNQYDKAMKVYNEALKINPNHYLTIFNLGELSHQMFLAGCIKCKDEAIGLYSRALELNPPPHVEKQAIDRITMLKTQ